MSKKGEIEMKFRQAYKIIKRPSVGNTVVYYPLKNIVVMIPAELKLSSKACKCFIRHSLRKKKKNPYTEDLGELKTEFINVEPILKTR